MASTRGLGITLLAVSLTASALLSGCSRQGGPNGASPLSPLSRSAALTPTGARRS